MHGLATGIFCGPTLQQSEARLSTILPSNAYGNITRYAQKQTLHKVF